MAELADALLPRGVVGGRLGVRPVALGKRRRNVFCIATKFQNVPLGNAHVLQELPGGVRRARWLNGAKFRGKIADRGVEIDMRAFHVEQVDEMLAKVVHIRKIARATIHKKPCPRKESDCSNRSSTRNTGNAGAHTSRSAPGATRARTTAITATPGIISRTITRVRAPIAGPKTA